MRKVPAVLTAILILCFAVTAVAETQAERSNIAVGDIVAFGLYEQDNDRKNGPEPIEWIVLAVRDGKALLLSRYGLEARPYNTNYSDTTWETCTLRAWMNSDFLKEAFIPEEESAILTTVVDNSDAQGYREWDTHGGNDTEDKVFLLSYAEANRYLGVTYENRRNTKSRVAPTGYAMKTGAWTSSFFYTADGSAAGCWWLRSPGSSQHVAARVDDDGSLLYYYVNHESTVVRPTLWLNLESGIF